MSAHPEDKRHDQKVKGMLGKRTAEETCAGRKRRDTAPWLRGATSGGGPARPSHWTDSQALPQRHGRGGQDRQVHQERVREVSASVSSRLGRRNDSWVSRLTLGWVSTDMDVKQRRSFVPAAVKQWWATQTAIAPLAGPLPSLPCQAGYQRSEGREPSDSRASTRSGHNWPWLQERYL